MLGHNNLLPRGRIPPFLVAPGLSYPQKTVMPKDADDLGKGLRDLDIQERRETLARTYGS